MIDPVDDPEFLAEIDRQIDEVNVHGNFTRASVVDGVIYRQRFRDHKPVGEPVYWRALSKEKP